MRSKNSIRNIRYNIIFFIISYVFIFILKKVFIVSLGPEMTGLNDLFKNIIGFLNIAELGIMSAVTFSLYTPLNNKNFIKINSILAIYRYMYRIISLVIFIGSIIVCLFIALIIKNNTINVNFVRISFLIFSLSTCVSYLFTYLQVLAIADEKMYIVTKITGICNITKNIVQIVTLLYSKNYILYLLLEVLFNIASYEIVNRTVRKQYKWINLNINCNMKKLFSENKNLFTNTRNLFVHKIGSFVLFQTDNILISAFINLKSVAIYTSYMMIVTGITQLFNQIYNGIRASIGNLISENNDEKSFNLWRKIYIAAFFLSIIVCFSFYKVASEFVELWIGKQFLLNDLTLLCLTINLFFAISRQSIDSFKDGYGIFWDTGSPIFEALINIIISIILVQKYGIIGVVIGTNVSNFIIIFIWKSYIVFKEGFKRSILDYLFIIIKLIIFSVIALSISNVVINKIFILLPITNIINFIIKAIIVFSICSSISFLVFLIDKEFRKIFISFISFKFANRSRSC